MTTARFAPAEPLRGRYRPPPDKSVSHRAALVGAMVDEPLVIRNYLDSEDTNSTLRAIERLGAGVERDGADVLVRGCGLYGAFEVTGGTIDVGNAGTLMRILPGWLAGQRQGGIWTLDGDASIRRRPVGRIAEPLRRMGARVEARDGLPPLTVSGGQLQGCEHRLPVASAQVKSCLLVAGMLAAGETVVHEPHQSRDHTERMLASARVPVRRDGATTRVSPVDELEADELVVPGDPSSAAFLIAATCLVPGSRLVVEDHGLNWTRTGFVRILERMGAVVVGDLERPPADPAAPVPTDEPAGELDVRSGPLTATTVEPAEVPLAIDELPLVALLGCFAEGETVVRGAEELRVKESDRIAGVVDGLRALGADIEATADGFAVRGPDGIDGGRIDSRGDHRLAMLGAVAGLASRRGVEVEGMEAAAVSYPAFERDLAALTAR